MAKDLSLAPGIGADGDYLNGNLVDEQTIINSYINQDIVQFFQKLIDLAGITVSGDFDNEANGYDFIDALYATAAEVNSGIIKKAVSTITLQTPALWNNASIYSTGGVDYANAGSMVLQYRKDNLGNVWIRFKDLNFVGTAGHGILFTLPVGYRPTYSIDFIIHTESGVIEIWNIGTNGDVKTLDATPTTINNSIKLFNFPID